MCLTLYMILNVRIVGHVLILFCTEFRHLSMNLTFFYFKLILNVHPMTDLNFQ